jgi:hypothetical protein
MRIRLHTYSVLLSFIIVGMVYALPTETLPTYHWAYQVIDELKLNCYLTELDLTERPLTRGQIARAVVKELNPDKDFDKDISPRERWLLKLLQREFATEIADSKINTEKIISETVERVISPTGLLEPPPFKGEVGARLEGDLATRQNHEPQTDGIAIAQVGVQFQSMVAAQTRLRLDSHLPDDSTYDGKVWRGLAGYAEAGYLRIDGRVFDIQIGRDRFTVGAGKTYHLLLSDYSLPLDAIWFSATLKGFRYSFLTSQLDTMLNQQYPNEVLRRYLSIHRLSVKPYSDLTIGLSEAIIYGGPNRQFELAYLNPFLYWHGEVLNRNGNGNIFLLLDLDWYPRTSMELYGEFLIDDFQIEKSTPRDLEPSELGWLIGTQFTNLPISSNMCLRMEYMGVTNRTYNSIGIYEKYLHDGQPLGCAFGNDFDHFLVSLSQWIRPDLQGTLSFSYLRKGEGSITAPFDTSYMQYTVAEGYNEPFPTGIIEKRTSVSLGVFYIPIEWGWVQLTSGIDWISNQNHISGSNSTEGWMNVNLVLEFDMWLK